MHENIKKNVKKEGVYMKQVLLPAYTILLFMLGGCMANIQPPPTPVEPPPPVITSPSESVNPEEVSLPSQVPETSPEPSETPETTIEPIETVEPVISNDNPWIDVVFVDVGQGDGAFIVTPNNDVIVIDAGVDKDAHQMIEALEKYDFEDIDLMILTHPHADHIGGAATLLNTYNVKEVLMSSYKATSKTYNTMMDDAAYTDIHYAQVGEEYSIDGVNIDILAVDTDPKDNNNSSIVARVEYNNVSFMFTGDAEEETENTILASNTDIYSNILKVGHHGSRTSSSVDFLKAVNPEYAIISCSIDNKYGHPHTETLAKFKALEIPYFTTVDKGNITVSTNGDDIVMTGSKESS